MTTGLNLPVNVDGQGRSSLVSGEEQTRKLVILELSPGDSANPFQDLGLKAPLFNLNDPETQTRVRARIINIFDRLNTLGRAKLADNGLVFEETEPDSGKMVARITYIDLETKKEVDVVLPREGTR